MLVMPTVPTSTNKTNTLVMHDILSMSRLQANVLDSSAQNKPLPMIPAVEHSTSLSSYRGPDTSPMLDVQSTQGWGQKVTIPHNTFPSTVNACRLTHQPRASNPESVSFSNAGGSNLVTWNVTETRGLPMQTLSQIGGSTVDGSQLRMPVSESPGEVEQQPGNSVPNEASFGPASGGDFLDAEAQIQVHPMKGFMSLLKHLGRIIIIIMLYILVILAAFLWIVGCFVCIMTGYCIVGCCINFANQRTGGCHDCPLICDGVERAVAWSHWGCQKLWSFTKKTTNRQNDVDRQPSAFDEGNSPITPPPRLYHHPFRDPAFVTVERAFDGVVDNLNAAADRVESAAFHAMGDVMESIT